MTRTTVLLPDDMYKELKEIAGAQSDFSKQLRAAVAHWIQLKRKKGKTSDKNL